jgi:peptide deformylase
MSDVLTINTDLAVKKEEEKIEPLPLFGEDYKMLDDEIPPYVDPLPNPYMSKLAKRLKMTMKLYGGIGLSANQCGVYERVFVIGTEHFQYVCINPKVVEVGHNLLKDKEGCLSYPGLYLIVERPESVLVEFTDENGQQNRMWFDGITARCFLHELDHMNGVRFTNHVKPVALRMAKQKQEKLMKKMYRNHKKAQRDAVLV